ncbi:MAG: 50S ribosomal protein L13 [Deltaproteobacteria bacterium]|nr:50S ribosomal protein L13 [Deltaproteobacteria bacterium]
MGTTKSFRTNDVERAWYVVDMTDLPLGRAATQIATILRGKHKPQFTLHSDVGDFVVAVNASKTTLTGNKAEREKYRWHTGYVGHLRGRTLGEMMEKKPEFMVRKAVKGMLPKGPLGRAMLRKLKVYAGAEHPHEAQQPEALDISQKAK